MFVYVWYVEVELVYNLKQIDLVVVYDLFCDIISQ
jgi:hypothetical protein